MTACLCLSSITWKVIIDFKWNFGMGHVFKQKNFAIRIAMQKAEINIIWLILISIFN